MHERALRSEGRQNTHNQTSIGSSCYRQKRENYVTTQTTDTRETKPELASAKNEFLALKEVQAADAWANNQMTKTFSCQIIRNKREIS